MVWCAIVYTVISFILIHLLKNTDVLSQVKIIRIEQCIIFYQDGIVDVNNWEATKFCNWRDIIPPVAQTYIQAWNTWISIEMLFFRKACDANVSYHLTRHPISAHTSHLEGQKRFIQYIISVFMTGIKHIYNNKK
jgi:hypothetical protein